MADPGHAPPGGVSYALTQGWLRTTQALAADLGAKLILGINLAAGRPGARRRRGPRALQGIGRRYIDALEIGNEPDLYGVVPWYRDRRGREFFARAGAATASRTYIARVHAVAPGAAADPARRPGASLADLAGRAGLGSSSPPSPGWAAVTVPPLPAARLPSPTRARRCSRRSRTCSPTAPPAAWPQALAPYVAAAHAHGRPVPASTSSTPPPARAAAGSATRSPPPCGCSTRCSTWPASASTASTSTRCPAPRYELFTPQHSSGGNWQAFVHPEYYGDADVRPGVPARRPAAAGQRARRPGQGLGDRVAHRRHPGGRDQQGPGNAQTVQVSVPAPGRGQPRLVLRAPSIAATGGVTLGSQSFGTDTRTGLLSRRSPHRSPPRAASTRSSCRAASAVLLTQ